MSASGRSPLRLLASQACAQALVGSSRIAGLKPSLGGLEFASLAEDRAEADVRFAQAGSSPSAFR